MFISVFKRTLWSETAFIPWSCLSFRMEKLVSISFLVFSLSFFQIFHGSSTKLFFIWSFWIEVGILAWKLVPFSLFFSVELCLNVLFLTQIFTRGSYEFWRCVLFFSSCLLLWDLVVQLIMLTMLKTMLTFHRILILPTSIVRLLLRKAKKIDAIVFSMAMGRTISLNFTHCLFSFLGQLGCSISVVCLSLHCSLIKFYYIQRFIVLAVNIAGFVRLAFIFQRSIFIFNALRVNSLLAIKIGLLIQLIIPVFLFFAWRLIVVGVADKNNLLFGRPKQIPAVGTADILESFIPQPLWFIIFLGICFPHERAFGTIRRSPGRAWAFFVQVRFEIKFRIVLFHDGWALFDYFLWIKIEDFETSEEWVYIYIYIKNMGNN